MDLIKIANFYCIFNIFLYTNKYIHLVAKLPARYLGKQGAYGL